MIESLGGFVPHPVTPGIDVAIAAAEQVLANRDNKILLAHRVQLHALATMQGANGADNNVIRMVKTL